MRCGEIWMIDLNPTRGDEIQKTRPAVIVNDDLVGTLALKIIVPITDWKDHYAKVDWMARLEPNQENGLIKAQFRLHETNFKKQGILALTFKNPADYDLIREDDRVSIIGLSAFAPGKSLLLRVKHADGTEHECELNHSYNETAIAWFKSGSALNLIGKGV